MPRWRDDPAQVRPMLASLDDPPLIRRGMIYEPKYDGIRALIDVVPPAGRGQPPRVILYSRNGHDKSPQFPAIVRALESIAARLDAPVLLDGEVVATDKSGKALGFQSLQGRIHLTSPPDIARAERDQPAALLLFDLLRDGDEDLRSLPMAARRLRLQERIRPRAAESQLIRLTEIAADDGREMYERARREGWEGLIVKDGQSVYQSGRRSPAWRKKKILAQQEFVVGGWTEPRQTRTHFGSLLVGYYDGAGALEWAGAVGTGFDQKELDRVFALLTARTIPKSPFAGPVRTMEEPHWVRPEIVVEVRFTEWTADGMLRQPVYLGTRDDKRPKEVVQGPTTSYEVLRGPTRSYEVPRAPAQSHEVLRDRTRSSPPAKAGSLAKSDSPAKAKAPARTKAPAKATVPGTATARGKAARPADGRRLAQEDSALRALIDRLHELEQARKDGDLALPNGDTLRVTNLSKVFWPALKITKGDLLRYYVEVSPYLLPAVDDRPLVMKRFPNGVDKQAFYQQRHPETPPPGVRREILPEDVEPILEEEGPRDRLIGGSLTTLIYMTQLAAISQDPWFSRVSDPMHADYVAIDLDPGEGAGFDRVIDVARWVKDEMDRLGIPGVPKTSGSRGLHIYIPLPPQTTYETGQLLCEILATIVASKHPKIATIERFVKRRPRGTVYVDYLQNILGKTLATAYSARASDYAGVSTPLAWDEVGPRLDPRAFTIRTALARFRAVGDRWAPLRSGAPVDLKNVLRRALKT